jgi:sugar phosphate isomerase/epimerase
MKTRTGEFPIGFRRGWSDWQKDVDGLIEWSRENGLEVIDFAADGNRFAGIAVEAGMRIGSVDLPDWNGMISADKGKRSDAAAKNTEYIEACAPAGSMNHFVVMLPEDPALPLADNFKFMADSFSLLAPALEKNSAHLVIEGYPGPGALCCTPEGYRAFFKEVPSKAMGINFDPSHLIRIGIDPVRFIREFADRVFHVHGKDTELFPENIYEYGLGHPATFAEGMSFGGLHWRYTIPGHGCMRWTEAFGILRDAGYRGCVSVELEDRNFNGKTETEKQGILLGAQYLAGC